MRAAVGSLQSEGALWRSGFERGSFPEGILTSARVRDFEGV